MEQTNKTQQLADIFRSIEEEFSKSESWSTLPPHDKLAAVEQVFILKYTKFPARVALAAALALLEDEPTYKSCPIADKMHYRGLLQAAGTNIAYDETDKHEPILTDKVLEPLKEFCEKLDSDVAKRVVACLIGESNLSKIQ